jgi:hypothetical protein
MSQFAIEVQLTLLEQLSQRFAKQSPEQTAQHLHRDEKVFPFARPFTRNPSGAVER